MNAFVTGSRAYGTPSNDSDTDLVIRVSYEDFIKLAEAAGRCDEFTVSVPHSLQFGKLNVIALTSDEEYNKWKAAYDICKSKAPCSREKAIKIHNKTGATG